MIPFSLPFSLSGVLIVDKPRGPTSHDVVMRLRRALHIRAVGHAGTLDPMATGVLVVALGEGTKLVPWLTAHDKAYVATIELGVETDTLDAAGAEVRRVAPTEALREALREEGRRCLGGRAVEHSLLREALDRERARTLQIPPAYSAIRTDGERSFARARRGDVTALAPRPVSVRQLELLACQPHPPSLDVRVETGKGYYVRALARDLAEGLGTVGHLTALRRTRSGCFVAGEALPLDASTDELIARVEPLARAATRALPVTRLSEAGARDARHGRRVLASEMESAAELHIPSAWLDADGALVAVGQLESDGQGKVLRGFNGASAAGE